MGDECSALGLLFFKPLFKFSLTHRHPHSLWIADWLTALAEALVFDHRMIKPALRRPCCVRRSWVGTPQPFSKLALHLTFLFWWPSLKQAWLVHIRLREVDNGLARRLASISPIRGGGCSKQAKLYAAHWAFCFLSRF